MKSYGLVSIIMPSYNCEAYIDKSINSILAQTYTDWELLITDDCSTDGTCRIVDKYAKNDSRIKLFRLDKNSGAGVARNNSIRHASGRFIAFCDSDDQWRPQKLEKQIPFMAENGHLLTFTSMYRHNEDTGRTLYEKCPRKVTFGSEVRCCHISCSTAIYDASRIGKYYLPKVRKRQDWGLWLTILRDIKVAYGVQDYLVDYLERGGSISHQKSKLIKYNIGIYRHVLGYSFIKSWLIFLFGFTSTYIVKRIKRLITKE